MRWVLFVNLLGVERECHSTSTTTVQSDAQSVRASYARAARNGSFPPAPKTPLLRVYTEAIGIPVITDGVPKGVSI